MTGHQYDNAYAHYTKACASRKAADQGDCINVNQFAVYLWTGRDLWMIFMFASLICFEGKIV